MSSTAVYGLVCFLGGMLWGYFIRYSEEYRREMKR